MHKVYLLLRDNKQSGPFTLEELVQCALKPLDLIWVEGQSGSWAYPSEIAILKPYLQEQASAQKPDPVNVAAVHEAYMPPGLKDNPEQKASRSPKVYVSLPPQTVHAPSPVQQSPQALSLEQRADELRARVQAQPAQRKPADNDMQVKSYRPSGAVQEDSTSWVFSKKNRNNKELSPRSTAITAVLLLAATIFLGRYAFTAKEKSTTPVTSIPVKTIQEAVPRPATEAGLVEPINTPEEAAVNYAQNVANDQAVKKTITLKLPINNKVAIAGKQKAVPIASNKEHLPVNDRQPEESTQSSPNAAETVLITTPQKKKKFGERLDDFFNKLKRKKGDEKPVTAGEPMEQPEAGAAKGSLPERKARRRNEEENAPVTILDNPEATIKITVSEPGEKWMLGIHGLKITLQNTSGETIKTATVEIRYFDEQNVLLETRTIVFNKIPAKKSLTMAAPDHRLAAHTEHRLVSATQQLAF